MPTPLPPHPIQPLVVDEHDVLRFRANAIVKHLLQSASLNLNQLAELDFSREDREQFAQLIGYSQSGASGLDYMNSEVLDAAQAAFDDPENPAAREQSLRAQISELRGALRDQKNGWALGAQLDAIEEHIDSLAAALEWYVENDDTNEGQEGNEFWIDGRDRARRLLEQVKASRESLTSETGPNPKRMPTIPS